MIPANSRA